MVTPVERKLKPNQYAMINRAVIVIKVAALFLGSRCYRNVLDEIVPSST
jgi:hypothetical protein